VPISRRGPQHIIYYIQLVNRLHISTDEYGVAVNTGEWWTQAPASDQARRAGADIEAVVPTITASGAGTGAGGAATVNEEFDYAAAVRKLKAPSLYVEPCAVEKANSTKCLERAWFKKEDKTVCQSGYPSM
jgi:hypothetical protein